jgi:hypothetical protein
MVSGPSSLARFTSNTYLTPTTTNKPHPTLTPVFIFFVYAILPFVGALQTFSLVMLASLCMYGAKHEEMLPNNVVEQVIREAVLSAGMSHERWRQIGTLPKP